MSDVDYRDALEVLILRDDWKFFGGFNCNAGWKISRE